MATTFKPFLFLQGIMRWAGFGGSSQYTGEQLPTPLHPPPGVPQNVDESVALTLSALWGSVKILTETVVSMSLIVAKRLADGTCVPDPNNDLWRLLTMQPNAVMTHIDFWEAMMLNLVLRGNAYAWIVRNSTGQIIALYPLAASQMQPVRTTEGEMVYVYTLDGKRAVFRMHEVLHIKCFGNGYIGLSPLAYGQMAFGVAAASEKYAADYFTKGGQPTGALETDKVLDPEKRKDIRTSLQEAMEGSRLFVLEAGFKYKQVSLSPEDLQMIESRRYSVQDIARFFGVPSFLLNESQGSTTWGTGLEQQMLGFYTLVIRPLGLRICASIKQKMVAPKDWRTTEIYYDYAELMAVDLKAKADYLQKLTNSGTMTRNEARVKLGLPKATDKNADKLTVQTALTILEKLGETPPKLPAPGDPKLPGDDDEEDDKPEKSESHLTTFLRTLQ